jgi:hypothetical protein
VDEDRGKVKLGRLRQMYIAALRGSRIMGVPQASALGAHKKHGCTRSTLSS